MMNIYYGEENDNANCFNLRNTPDEYRYPDRIII